MIELPINCGIRINSTGGGSGAEYNLNRFVMSAGFKAFLANMEDSD